MNRKARSDLLRKTQNRRREERQRREKASRERGIAGCRRKEIFFFFDKKNRATQRAGSVLLVGRQLAG